MFIDVLNRYWNAQALAADGNSDIIDHGVDRNLGIGEPMVIAILLTADADDTDGDETYVVNLTTDDAEGFGTKSTVASVNIPRGSVAGTMFFINIPPNGAIKRYTRLEMDMGGASPAGVSLTAWLTKLDMVEARADYDDAITITD